MHLRQLQAIPRAYGLFLKGRKFGASIDINALCPI